MMRSFCCLTILLCAFLGANAQTFSAGPSKETETFFYRVKSIDDFIERFNDDPRSSVRREFKNMEKEAMVSRPKLLLSVFNWQNEALKASTNTQDFFNQILDSAAPLFVRFTDSNWYADALCDFSFDDKVIQMRLVLHVKHMGEKGTKWMIAGVQDHAILGNANVSENGKSPGGQVKQSIPPSNYAVNFLELRKVLNKDMDETSCFASDFLLTNKGKQLVQLVKEQRLKFVQATEMKFYFLQLSDWIFTVEEFNRNTKNSGWLINEIRKVSEVDKDKVKLALLYRI
mgnify:CR=1 FL=1